jgi:aminopeptidase 2
LRKFLGKFTFHSPETNDSVKEEAQRRFNAWKTGHNDALPPSLRRVVFGIVLSEDASDEDYDAVLAMSKTSQSADAKEIALAAIGDVTSPRLIQKTIDLIFSGEIPAQDIHGPCNSLATNPKTRNLWWEEMKKNWRFVPLSQLINMQYHL